MPLRDHREKTPCCFGDKTSHTDTARRPECRQTRIQPRRATSSASSPPVLPAPADTQVHGMPFFSSSSSIPRASVPLDAYLTSQQHKDALPDSEAPHP